jgi:hypothetical protein
MVMTKYLLLLTATLFSFQAKTFGDEAQSVLSSDAFEAELRMLEAQNEAAFARAEALTNKERQALELSQGPERVTDSVSTTNAALKKEEVKTENSEIVITAPVVKTRRIRSR